jgi:regulator of protease activity HflC (stomatin/prohibitin superfamily)
MNKQFTTTLIIGGIILVIVILFGSSMFFKLQPGERAIIFYQFTDGLDKGRVHEPGFHIVAPWNDFIIYSVKEQTKDEPMDVLDKNGLSISVDISVRFNPIYSKIGYLHEIFGQDYINRLVVPEMRSSVRKVMGRYTAEEIYSTQRKQVEDQIIEETGAVLRANNIDMRALLIRSINLPTNIKNAIETKLTQEQEALAYQFKLEREKSEAERKRIEADGIARYNMIINSSLTKNILTQKGIDATLKLAESPNSKVVVIGNNEGMPLILGN